jgi:hypothetical protein
MINLPQSLAYASRVDGITGNDKMGFPLNEVDFLAKPVPGKASLKPTSDSQLTKFIDDL